MCLDPATLSALTLAAQATGAVGTLVVANDSAKKQGAAIAEEAASAQEDLRRRQQQEQEAAAQAINEEARAAMKDRALFDALSGEMGGGNSVDRARAAGEVQTGERLATTARNGQLATTETAFRSAAVNRSANSQLASLQGGSVLGTALKLGSAALDYGTSMNKMKGPK